MTLLYIILLLGLSEVEILSSAYFYQTSSIYGIDIR